MLRLPRASDGAGYVALNRRSKRFHAGLASPPREAAAFRELLRRNRHPQYKCWLILRRADRAVIGAVELSQIVAGKFRTAYLGYHIGAPFARQGYMREALVAVLRLAFGPLRLHRVEANIQPRNRASIELVKTLSFRREGYSRRYLKIGGRSRCARRSGNASFSSARGPMDPVPENSRVGDFSNVYADRQRAASYAKLDFPGTYYLAFRDLPTIIGSVPSGATALDFGCGAGRSTRFLRRLGFDVVGVDISAEMLALACEADPEGSYRLVSDGEPNSMGERAFDLVLSAFTFDNVPGWENKERLLRMIGGSLRDGGRLINLVSSPEIYVHEWASFSTKEFPGNATAKTGDVVRTVMLDVADRRPVDDIFWTDADYREVYRRAGLAVREVHQPLGSSSDPCARVNETRVSPQTIYVLTP